MSHDFIDARSIFARKADEAAMTAARRDVVGRARLHFPPTPWPANDRDPAAAA